MPPTTLQLQPAALPRLLRGAWVRKIRQPEPDVIVLETHAPGGRADWLLSADPAGARLVQTHSSGGNAPRPGRFLLWLRTRLEGARVEEMTIAADQVVDLALQGKKGRFHLVLEMNGPASNLLLLDGERRVLATLHPQAPLETLKKPDALYRPPTRLYRYPRNDPPRLPISDGELVQSLDERWREYLAELKFKAIRKQALRTIRSMLGKLRRRLANVEADRKAAQSAEILRQWAELLQIHRHAIKAGMTELVVPNEFLPQRPSITISLDPALTPSENMQRFFQRYKKARDSAGHVERRLAATGQEIARWQEIHQRFSGLATPAELESVLAELSPAERAAIVPAPKEESGGQARRQIMSRVSADGYKIYVGRSKAENEEVTFHIGRGRDWWLHALGVEGAHVLVRSPDSNPLPPVTLRQAAWLAAYYSKGRNRGSLEVAFTQRKHVRKLKGGEQGQVTYSLGRTVWVDLADPVGRSVLGEALSGEIEV
jgi:predicted ribosome quality control (RQC) complex YloA/Tae2 family protein